ncbi:MAG: hypothetical protein ACK44A_07150 [Roseateles sp.]
MVSADRSSLDEALSAVQDGSATPQDWARVEAAWASDPALRARWADWQALGDGLRSAELLAAHRDPQRLLDALHAALPLQGAPQRRRREWLAPLGVAASFVVLAMGLTRWMPTAAPPTGVELARGPAVPLQALVGDSFAQTAAGRTLPAEVGLRDAAWPGEPTLAWPDAALTPQDAPSSARP